MPLVSSITPSTYTVHNHEPTLKVERYLGKLLADVPQEHKSLIIRCFATTAQLRRYVFSQKSTSQVLRCWPLWISCVPPSANCSVTFTVHVLNLLWVAPHLFATHRTSETRYGAPHGGWWWSHGVFWCGFPQSSQEEPADRAVSSFHFCKPCAPEVVRGILINTKSPKDLL